MVCDFRMRAVVASSGARHLPSELPARDDECAVRAEDGNGSAVGARQSAPGRESISGGGACEVWESPRCRVGVDVR
jgi:hypothetical protein